MATALAVLLGVGLASPTQAQINPQLTRLELDVLGVAATLDPLNPVVPKNVASGVRIEVRAGGTILSTDDVARFLGGTSFSVQAVLSGPGLPVALDLPLPDAPALDPLLLALPPLPRGGDYTLSNIRLVGAASSLDVTPSTITVQVIDQLLVTSVTTRSLTLDEIKARGIVLDRDDYLGFDFTIGLALESQPVNLTFPVVFDRNGVALPMALGAQDQTRSGISLPGALVPMLLEQEVVLNGRRERLPIMHGGEPVRIPSVMLIPGNVGYLKQFFSAVLYVANGAPGGSGLSVRDVTGKIKLPPGDDHVLGTNDDPLTIAETSAGHVDTLPIRAVGADGEPGTGDDDGTLTPGQQGQGEFLLRGEREGFHRIDFDIDATLDGLATGPVVVKGHASGGVLVRNPYFDVTFTVPSIVRADEPFKLYATVRNVGQGPANDVRVTLTGALANVHLADGEPSVKTIDTIVAGDARTVEFDLVPEVTGQVVASYLRFNGDAVSGTLRFTLGVGERGVPLSPDTLVLPAAVDALPQDVVRAAMRVLGQAWSIANAVPGTLPPTVARISKSVVIKKALALAEAGLRMTLGQAEGDAVRDVLLDFHGGEPLDNGFDQLLRQTEAGRALDLVLGAHLDAVVGANVLGYEADVAQVVGSGPDMLVFALESPSSSASDVQLTDGLGRRTLGRRTQGTSGADVPGAALVPLGDAASAPLLGVVARPTASPYVLELQGSGAAFDVSVSIPQGDGSTRRALLSGLSGVVGTRTRVTVDLARPDIVTVEEDAEGDGVYETRREEAATLLSIPGPELLSATVVGPETIDGAAPFGFNLALLFDRVVDDVTAADKTHYEIPDNKVRSARRQLSGRLVFANLELPEGPYVPTRLRASGIADERGHEGPSTQVTLDSRLTDPGAIVTGRIFNADGSTPTGAQAIYSAAPDWTECELPPTGFASMPLNGGGFYEFRYVHQDRCGRPFRVVTRDPSSNAVREVSGYVRAPGEHIVLDIALLGRGSVQGHVTRGGGGPAVGASVVALSQTDPQSGGRAQTDATGYYKIDGISVGPISVSAALGTGFGRGVGRIERAGTTATLDLTLDGDTVNVSGTAYRVVNGVDVPAPGLLVQYKIGDNLLVGLDTSDSTGHFTFSGMPVGAFVIEARVATGEHGMTSGVATAGQTISDLVLRLQPPDTTQYGALAGTVYLPGGTVPAGEGVFVGLDSAGVFTRADGTYTLPRVPVRPNQYQNVNAVTRDGQRRGTTRVIVSTPGEVVTGVDITLSGTGTARFVIKDPTGQPINGLQVGVVYGQCYEPCGCRFAATGSTGNDGEVAFDGIPVGRITARARMARNGVTDAVEGTLQIRFDGDEPTQVLQFGGTGRVTGLVTDDTQHGLHGAQVELVSNVFEYDPVNFICGLRPKRSHVTRTAPGPDPAIGTFAFDNVLVGPLRLSARQEFFPKPVGAQGVLTRAGEERHFEIALVNTFSGVVSGQVYLPDGVTLAGPGVDVKFDGPLPNVVVTTDESSRYSFDRILPAGFYTVTVEDPVTGAVVQERVHLRAGEDFARDFRLKGRGTVRVRVVDGADQPVPQAAVRLNETDYPNGIQERSLGSGADGWVEFARVFEGPFSITAIDTAARAGRVTGNVAAPGDVVELTLRLTTTGSVQGVFRLPPPAGTPIPFGIVKLVVGGRVLAQASTVGAGSELGSFRFDYVPAGPVRLEALDPLTGRSGLAFGEIQGEGDVLAVDVVAQGLGRVHGTVWSNGAPMPLARVELVAGGYRASLQANGQGEYDVAGVPEGHVVVTASVQGTGNFLAGTAAGDLVGDGSDLPLDVTLRGSGSVTGEVQPAVDGAPVPAAVVTATVGGFGGASLSTPTQPGGTFSFPVVPAGAAHIAADVQGSVDFGTATADVPAAGSAHVVVRLHGVGTLLGQAIKPDGITLQSWRVRFANERGQRFTLELPTSGANTGVFNLRDVLAGVFDVELDATLTGGSHLYGSASGTLVPGGETAAVVTLQPSGTLTGRVLRPLAAGGTVPGYGTELTLRGPSGNIRAQAGGDGVFTLRGVPVSPSAYTLEARDPVGGGRLVMTGIVMSATNETVALGDLVLDSVAPTLGFVAPQDGELRAGLKGTLRLSLDDVGSGVDTSSLVVIYPNGGGYQTATAFTFSGNEASAPLLDTRLSVGSNTVTAVVKDIAGHETRRTITWQVSGATLSGHVTYSDGSAAAGVSVKVGAAEAVVTDTAGDFVRTGLREGHYTVTATAPNGVSATLPSVRVDDGLSVTAPALAFPEFAPVVGYVRHPGGAGAGGVQVSISGRPAVTSRDGDGYFDLGFVGAGTYALSALAPNGDRASLITSVTPNSPPLELTLNGVGSVTVVVETATHGSVASATVVLSSSSPFGGAYTQAHVGPQGVTFPAVLAGTLTVNATDDATQLRGSSAGFVSDGGSTTITVTLEAGARIAGRITPHGGGAGVSGVQVQLFGARLGTVTTDAAGDFAFENLPLGSYTLLATAADGDRAEGTVTLSAAGATGDGSLELNGLAELAVSVLDAADVAVANASVHMVSPRWSAAWDAVTGAAGEPATFTGVLAGAVTISASANGLGGQQTATLNVGPGNTAVVHLQAAGTISGHVYAADGTTGVDGVTLRLDLGRTVVSHDGGVYEFTSVPLGSHNLRAEVAGRVRAYAASVVLGTNNQTVTQDLTLIGVATVSGTVFAPGGTSPAAGAQVGLTSLAAWPLGGSFTTTSATDGTYSLANVPVGAFRITASRVSQGQRVDSDGAVTLDGQAVTKDLTLLASVVNLPLSLPDGNAFPWTLMTPGGMRHFALFSADGPALSLVRDGQRTAFVGPGTSYASVASEENKREVVIDQANLAGLHVMRKVFVPADGYFVRWLEVLENTGPDPVTVDVVVQAPLKAGAAPFATSSGDALLDASDRWVALDDADARDVYESAYPPGAFPPLVFVGAGAGGTQAPTIDFSSSTLTWRWNSVVVPAGARRVFLHLLSPQTDQARALAAAQRLEALPPEALAGLSLDEAADVQNFSVPADLSSALAPLGANDGAVDVRVLGGDSTTPVPGVFGHFRSRSPYYGRRLDLGPTAADGSLSLRAQLDPPYGVRLVPRDDFDVDFSTTVFGTQTATASAVFPAQGAAAVDVVFAGTGALDGQVRRADTTAVPGSNVSLSAGATSVERRNLGNDGRFVYAVVPAGTYTLQATHPLGGVSVSSPVVVSAGQKTTQDLVFPALGSVHVAVRTAAPASQVTASWLRLEAPGVTRTGATSVSSGGAYDFVDVPPGTYTLTATDPRNNAVVTQAGVIVSADVVTNVDVTLPPTASLTVRARVAGRDLGAAQVHWRSDTHPTEVYAGLSSSSLASLGTLTIPNAAGPQVHVRVVHPASVHAVGEADVALTSEGTPVSVTVDVPGVGSVQGVSRTRDGVEVSAVTVSALHAAQPTTFASVKSDSAGAFTLSNLPQAALRLRTRVVDAYAGASTYARGELRAEITADGVTLVQDALVARGRLVSAGQRELWEFEATAGAAVDILLVGAAHGNAPALANPALEVYGPDGALVASNDDISVSDANARVTFNAPAAGRYAVVVHASGTGTGAYRLLSGRDDETHVFRAYAGGAVSGVVTHAGTGQSLAGWPVRLRRAGTVTVTTATDASGRYELPLFAADTYSVEVVDADGVVVARAMDVVAATADARLVRDFALPAREQVTVHVQRGTAPLAGIAVTITSDHGAALPEDATRVVTTATSGDALAVIPLGTTITASAVDTSSQTTVTTTGGPLVEGTPLTLTLTFAEAASTIAGIVNTTVDPALALPGAQVELRLVGAPTAWATTTTDAAGAYRFDGIPSGTYTLTASYATVTANREVVASGGVVTADVALPLSVLTGTARETDATPVAGARITACGYVGSVYTCPQQFTDAAGVFVFRGLPAWNAGSYINVTAAAQDGSYGSASTSTAVVAGPTKYTVNLTLPDTDARLRVRVFDATGLARVPGARVSLINSADQLDRSAVADAQGEVLFRRVPTVYGWRAYAEDADGVPGISPTVSVVAGANPDLDVTLMESATLSLTLDDGAGQLLARNVTVTAPDVRTWYDWPIDGLQRWTHVVTTSDTGPVTQRVPAGLYRVIFGGDDDGSGLLTGQAGAEGDAVAGATVSVALTRGTHTRDTLALDGPLASYCLNQPPSRYTTPACDTPSQPVVLTYAADTVGVEVPPSVVTPELAQRGYASFLVKGAQVELRRRQWVAPSGEFERTLSVLHNPTNAVVNVTLSSFFNFGYGGYVATTSNGDPTLDVSDSYVVVGSTAANGVPVSGAAVFGSALPATSLALGGEGSNEVQAEHNLTLLPGETRAFLTFTAWQAGDYSGLSHPTLALANSLADLSHPDALTGLTQEERDLIVNFAAPAAPTGVTGTVTGPGGAVPGAIVAAYQTDVALGTVIVARTTADAAGVFTLRGLAPGTAALVATDPVTNRPGRVADVVVTAAQLTPQDVALVADAETGTVVVAGGLALAGQSVQLVHESYPAFWSAQVTLDANGDGVFTTIPAGFVTLYWDGPSSGYSDTLVAGGQLNVTLDSWGFGASPPLETHSRPSLTRVK